MSCASIQFVIAAVQKTIWFLKFLILVLLSAKIGLLLHYLKKYNIVFVSFFQRDSIEIEDHLFASKAEVLVLRDCVYTAGLNNLLIL